MAVTATLLKHETSQPAAEPSAEWRGVVNTLRVIALECRAAARDDLFHACAMLSQSKTIARDAHARALFRCLAEALGKNAVFFRPGEATLSFDEAWLTRLLMASAANDLDSLTFLIRSRVAKVHQRHVAFLINGIVDQFGLKAAS